MDIRLVIHSFFLAVVLSLFVHAEGSSDEVQARVSTSSDLSIEAILEENKRQRAQIDWLQNVITRNISDLAAQINKNKEKSQPTRCLSGASSPGLALFTRVSIFPQDGNFATGPPSPAAQWQDKKHRISTMLACLFAEDLRMWLDPLRMTLFAIITILM